jgi:hypothetical protein
MRTKTQVFFMTLVLALILCCLFYTDTWQYRLDLERFKHPTQNEMMVELMKDIQKQIDNVPDRRLTMEVDVHKYSSGVVSNAIRVLTFQNFRVDNSQGIGHNWLKFTYNF